MRAFNTKYTKLSKVKRDLKKGILHVHAVRSKDRKYFRSDTYEIWYPVYDQERNPCKYFYRCHNCESVEKFELHGGNYKMSRHPCYKAHLARKNCIKKATKDASSEDSESDNESDSESDKESNIESGSKSVNKSCGKSCSKLNNKSEPKNVSKSGGNLHDESIGSKNLKLGVVIENFSKLCVQNGPISSYDAARLAPKPWKTTDW